MARYVFCPFKSQSALDLCKVLGATRLRNFDGLSFWGKRDRIDIVEGDTIVAWGTTLPALDGVRILNSVEDPRFMLMRYQDPPDLMSVGIRTPYRFETEEAARAHAKAYMPGQEWPLIGRKHKRHSGSDLLLSTQPPYDYLTFQYPLEKEYRIHIMDGKVLRTGERVLKDDSIVVPALDWKPGTNLAHPWVRTGMGGWRWQWETFGATPTVRANALAILKILNLSFGVVDIGMMSASHGYLMTGLSLAPRLDETGLDIYAKAIAKWEEKHDSSRDGRGGEAEIPVPPDPGRPVYHPAAINIPPPRAEQEAIARLLQEHRRVRPPRPPRG